MDRPESFTSFSQITDAFVKKEETRRFHSAEELSELANRVLDIALEVIRSISTRDVSIADQVSIRGSLSDRKAKVTSRA